MIKLQLIIKEKKKIFSAKIFTKRKYALECMLRHLAQLDLNIVSQKRIKIYIYIPNNVCNFIDIQKFEFDHYKLDLKT